MINRLHLVRGTILAACPVTLLVVTSFLSVATHSTLLSPAVMDLSRGNNQDKHSGSFLCNALGSIAGCDITHVPGSTCITCENDNYTDTGSATGGGMNAGAANGGSCGNVWSGICDLEKVCVRSVGGRSGTACTLPPSPPVEQPN